MFFSSSPDCYLGSPAHSCYGCAWLSHSILGCPGAGTGEGEREGIEVEPGAGFHPQLLQHDLSSQPVLPESCKYPSGNTPALIWGFSSGLESLIFIKQCGHSLVYPPP